MANYIQLPNGSYYQAAEGQSYLDAIRDARKYYPDAFGVVAQTTPPETGFIPSVKRGFAQTGMLLGDVLPAMAARAVGADEYANRQLAEAAATQKEIQEKYPAAVPSFTDIKGPGDAFRYITEAIGESIPSLIPALFTGGAAAVLARPATAAAMEAAKQTAAQQVAQAAAKGALSAEAIEAIKQAALAQGTKAAQNIALKYQAAGAITGSAAQNVPEVYQNILEETGKEELGAALVGGGFNAVLDAITPINLLRKARAAGIPSQEIVGAWYKRAGKGVAEGFLTESATEAVQEMSSAAAVKFVDENKDFFTKENLVKFLDAGLRGGIGGGAVTGAANVAFGTKESPSALAEQQRAAQQAAAAEEAARNQPEALNQLYDQYQALNQQKAQLDEQVNALRPKKGSTAEEKQAFQNIKTQRDEFVKTQFKPVELEYNKRKGAIDQMFAQRQADLEAQAAATQPAAKSIAPSDLPGAQPFQLAPVPRLMGTYGDLRTQLNNIQTQLAAGPDTATHAALETQRQQLAAQMDELAPIIEERGGTVDTPEELDKKIKAAEKERIKFLEQGDFDAAAQQIEKLNALQLKLPMLEEARLTREQAGQTRELFKAEPPQPQAQGIKYVSPTGAPISTVAEKPEDAAVVPVDVIPPKQLENVDSAKTTVRQAEQALTDAATTKNTESIYKAVDTLNQAEYALARARENVGRPALKPVVLDLFDPYNLMQEALRRGDTKLLNDLARQVNSTTLRQSLDEKASERNRLMNVVQSRLDAEGTKRERTDLFSQIYDAQQQARFKNGTYPDKELQEMYDRGGVELVENAWVADQVKPLMAKVTTPQGNAKKSLYQMLVETAAEHARLTEQMESGVATPTMGEKVAGVQAKLGKGEAPAARMMDAAERYQLQRKIDGLLNKYRMIEGKITPIRDQILAIQNSLYKTTPLKKPSVERAEKQAASTEAAKGRKTISRTAATASRLARGDVRKEAEASQKLRDLALELGMREPAYAKLEKDATKRMTALEERYGDDDPQVRAYRKQVAEELPEKARALGRQTPEYKATLKEQIAYFQEVLPTAGKQEVPTKRTTQVTRKQTAAPKRMVTSSAESKAATAREQEAYTKYRGSLKDVQEALASEKEGPIDFDGPTVLRKRGDRAKGSVDAVQAQKVIDGLKLPENVKFVYAPTAGEIPVKLLKQMAREGVDPVDGMVQGAVFSDGTVLVVGDQHTSIRDLEETIAHELIGHYGIDTVIGKERLNKFAQDTDVVTLAEQLGGKALVQEVVSTVKANADLGRSEEVQKLQALREIIAHTEEARVTESYREKAGRWLKEFVGMVRAGLRDMGFTELPRLSTSDVFYMLKQSRKAFASGKLGPYRTADGQIAFRTRRGPSSSVVGREPGFIDTFFGNFFGLAGRVQYVDRWGALRAAIKEGMSAGQIDSLEATNAEYLINFGQQTSQYAQQTLVNGPMTLELTKKDGFTQSLFRSTKGVNMLDVAETLNAAKIAAPAELENMFTVYLAGERAKQVGWEKLNFENPGKAKAEYDGIIAQLNADKQAKEVFEKAKKLYQQYNANQLDLLVQTGVMTPQKAAELKSINYVPYYRVSKNGEVQLMIDKETPVRISNIKDEPQLQSLVGGNEYILPIFTSAVQNTYMLTHMALRNQTVKEMAFLLQKLGIASRLSEGAGPAGPDVVRFKKNGKDYHVVIDTDLYGIPADLIIKGMEGIKTTMPGIVRLMGYPADILRTFVTRMPTYAIRQMIRDPLNAWMTTGTDAMPVLSSMKELATMMAGRNETQRKLMETGAISSNVFSGDERDMAKFIKDISAGKSLWAKTLAKADALAMQADAATRVVVYKDSLAKGMSEQEALNRTLESMNFGRRGVSPSMHWLSVMIPFFNAQIQGLDVIYRAYKGDMPYSEQLKIKEKMIARGAMLAVGTIAYAALMSDDEAYKRAKPEERFSNWFVYIPGVSEPVRVPIPFELGFLFKALPEAVYGLAFNDEKASKTLKGLGKLVDQSNPFSLPQAIKPLTEVVLGRSFFQGDIESAREKEQMVTDRYRTNTTEVAKLLGQVTGKVGVSPIEIDYLIRGYFGGLGIAITQLANPILTVGQKEAAQPSTKPSKLPFIGGLFQPVEGRGTLDEAYDRMQEIKQVKGTYNKLIEDGKRAEAQEFVQRYTNDLTQASVSGRVQKQLGELAKQERIIKAHPTMPTEEKDRRLEQLDKLKVQLARQFLAVAR